MRKFIFLLFAMLFVTIGQARERDSFNSVSIMKIQNPFESFVKNDFQDFYTQTLNPQDYCIPAATPNGRYISGFTVTGGTTIIMNPASGSSPNGYGNFYANQNVTQVQSQGVDFNASFVGGTFGMRIWVDWNQDEVFDPVTELAFASTATASSQNGTIVVPTNAAVGETRMRIVAHWNDATANIDPCSTTLTDGEFEDYKFTVTALEPCTGTPTVENITGPSLICPNIGFTLSGTPILQGGISYQWQENTGSGWVNIPNAINANYDVAGITVDTDYRLTISCSYSGTSANSNVLSVEVNTDISDCFCIPEGTNTSRYINNFSTTGGAVNISNLNSGFATGGYGDYFATQQVSQVQSQSFDFSAAISGGSAGFRVWVDWNHDGQFDPVTEVAYQSSSYSTAPTGTINIPVNALTGATRMRIVSHYSNASGAVDPCATGFSNGEFEDYNLNIVPLTPCTGTPSIDSVSGPSLICPNIEFDLSITPILQSGITYQWQQDTGSGWANIAGANNPSYSLSAGITEDTSYRVIVTCTNGGGTVTSNELDVTVNTNTNQCYCIPEGTNSTRYINDFSTTGGSVNISNLATGFSNGGYGDFSLTHGVSALQTESISFSANVLGGTAGFRIWVDWNQDGQFDPVTEVAYQSNSYSSSPSGSFAVPITAAAGETRMRIVSHWSSTTGSVDPCATGFISGEFEDYKFTVEPIESCTGTPTVEDITGPSLICPNVSFTLTGTLIMQSAITYQWQEDNGSGWANIPNANLATYTVVDGIDSDTSYRSVVTCTASGESTTSNEIDVEVNNNTNECYCIPVATNSARYINNFSTTGGTENISNLVSGFSAGGYGDFSLTHGASQIQGEVVNFASTVEGGTAGFRIWVDWNQDGIFDVNTEVAYNSSSYSGSPSGSFTVPTNATLGETRMRIVSHWLSSAGIVDPCVTNFEYGEFEDYKFTVVGMDDCSGTPEAGTATVNPAYGNMGSTYTVSANGYSIANGLTYQWQSNTAGAGWVDEGTATATYANFVATAPSEIGVQVEWRLAVTCTSSGETAYSATATFETEMAYCIPDFTFGVEAITRVVFAGIDNSSSPDSTVEYENFADIVGVVEQGESYDIALEGNTKGNFINFFTVWIDWNQNGTFESTEMFEIGSITSSNGTDGQQATGSIAVPMDASNGLTKMRVLKNYDISPTDPCGTYSFGQTEDYTIQVGGLGVGDLDSSKFTYYPNPVKDVLNFTSQKDVKSVSIFNLSGQNVMNTKVANSQINVSALTPGVYVFKVTFENGKAETFKIIKK